jgi:uncharacterized membrane protein
MLSNTEIIRLVEEYAKSDESTRGILEKKHPHINYKGLMADANVMQRVREAKELDGIHIAQNSQDGNIWISVLEVVAWLLFIVTIAGGIFGAVSLSEITGGGFAFLIFLISAISALIILSAIMVSLTLAKDISRTAKDTAEIKEILKNK